MLVAYVLNKQEKKYIFSLKLPYKIYKSCILCFAKGIPHLFIIKR